MEFQIEINEIRDEITDLSRDYSQMSLGFSKKIERNPFIWRLTNLRDRLGKLLKEFEKPSDSEPVDVKTMS